MMLSRFASDCRPARASASFSPILSLREDYAFARYFYLRLLFLPPLSPENSAATFVDSLPMIYAQRAFFAGRRQVARDA